MNIYFINFDCDKYDEVEESLNLLNNIKEKYRVFFIHGHNINTKGKTIRKYDAEMLCSDFLSNIQCNKNEKKIIVCRHKINHYKRWFLQESSNTLLVSTMRLGELPIHKLMILIVSAYYSSFKYSNLKSHSSDCCFNMKTNKTVITSTLCDECHESLGESHTEVQNIIRSCHNYNKERSTEVFNSSEKNYFNYSLLQEWWFICVVVALISLGLGFYFTQSFLLSVLISFFSTLVVSMFNPKRRYLKLAFTVLGIGGLGGLSSFLSGKLDYSQSIDNGSLILALEFGKQKPILFYITIAVLIAFLVFMDSKQK